MKKDQVREFLKKIGAKGGKRCLETMTAEQRADWARKAVAVRERKRTANA